MVSPFRDIFNQLNADNLSGSLHSKIAHTKFDDDGRIMIVIQTAAATTSFDQWARNNVGYLKIGSTGTVKDGYFVTLIEIT
jgi:hypothetical protein